ncbi:phage baseplate assembly protein [Caballeronia cordobensis]|uniref:phage baseplate assembly protein n=1 Tax=Caballeronia cordobensis TaxID=1353886 RepID=UPI00045F06A7|nr:putative membrane protein [Burkholderia sp. RPE67]
MTDEVNAVRLIVNGKEYVGWKSVEITAGIERQARDFELSVTDKWPGQKDIPRRIRPGDECEVFIGKDRVLTGYVDATPIRYDGASLTVGVKGRSKTADLVDCSAVNKPGSWGGAKVERIAADLAGVYGIAVVTEVDTGEALAHAIDQGESVFESIDRMLKLRQLLATDDALGRLVFIDVGSAGTAATSLKLGENIMSAEAGLDYKDVYTEYICKGQRSGSDDDFGDTVAGEFADITDTSVMKRHRVLLKKSSGQTDGGTAAQRVKYEQAHRKAKALETTYTVQGWRQADGKLWLHNQFIRVIDPVIGFDDEFVVAEITYSLSDQGMLCRLQVGPKDGYVNSPAKKGGKKKGTGEGGEWKDVQPADSKAPKVNNPVVKSKDGWKDVKR